MSGRVPEIEVPFELRQLIAQRLESMEQVEVLVLLARTEPRRWSSAEVAAELRWPQPIAVNSLEELACGKLLTRAGTGAASVTYEYAPPADDRESIAALIHLYETRPLVLGRLIYDRPPTVARSFADAFRIRSKRRE